MRAQWWDEAPRQSSPGVPTTGDLGLDMEAVLLQGRKGTPRVRPLARACQENTLKSPLHMPSADRLSCRAEPGLGAGLRCMHVAWHPMLLRTRGHCGIEVTFLMPWGMSRREEQSMMR